MTEKSKNDKIMFMKEDYKYYVYIMASASGTLYIGMTDNLVRRVLEHKNKINEGFTKKYGCNKLAYYESYSSPSRAIFREKELKGWKRYKKENLIKELNPHWDDLFSSFFT